VVFSQSLRGSCHPHSLGQLHHCCKGTSWHFTTCLWIIIIIIIIIILLSRVCVITGKGKTFFSRRSVVGALNSESIGFRMKIAFSFLLHLNDRRIYLNVTIYEPTKLRTRVACLHFLGTRPFGLFRFRINFRNYVYFSRTASMGDPTITWPLPTHDSTARKNADIKSMLGLGFEPTIPLFEWSKTIRALDCTVTGTRVNK
jgi:hypothetical protein